MSAIDIAVCNASSLIKPEDLETMVIACLGQMKEHFAPAWGYMASAIAAYNTPTAVPTSAALILLMDDTDDPQALGWHSEEAGRKIGRDFVKPVIAAGAQVLTGPCSVASVLSHEILELVGNPSVNAWVEGPDGQQRPREMCDAVQGDVYPIPVNGIDVTVSNFLLPTWFDAQTPTGTKVDYLGKAPGPFALAHGGYTIIRTTAGQQYPIYADEEGRKACERKLERGTSRIAILAGRTKDEGALTQG